MTNEARSVLGQDLEHYGVLGMKWGVRKDRTSRKTNREATKDAKEFARAKMYYGEGAGIRRRHINNAVKSKSKDPAYKKAFDSALASRDMAKDASKARGERKRKNVSNSTRKTIRGVGHMARGNKQYASLVAATLFSAGAVAYRAGGDKIVKKYGAMAVNDIRSNPGKYDPREWMKKAGF